MKFYKTFIASIFLLAIAPISLYAACTADVNLGNNELTNVKKVTTKSLVVTTKSLVVDGIPYTQSIGKLVATIEPDDGGFKVTESGSYMITSLYTSSLFYYDAAGQKFRSIINFGGLEFADTNAYKSSRVRYDKNNSTIYTGDANGTARLYRL